MMATINFISRNSFDSVGRERTDGAPGPGGPEGAVTGGSVQRLDLGLDGGLELAREEALHAVAHLVLVAAAELEAVALDGGDEGVDLVEVRRAVAAGLAQGGPGV